LRVPASCLHCPIAYTYLLRIFFFPSLLISSFLLAVSFAFTNSAFLYPSFSSRKSFSYGPPFPISTSFSFSPSPSVFSLFCMLSTQLVLLLFLSFHSFIILWIFFNFFLTSSFSASLLSWARSPCHVSLHRIRSPYHHHTCAHFRSLNLTIQHLLILTILYPHS
jgi:hypothetical protein